MQKKFILVGILIVLLIVVLLAYIWITVVSVIASVPKTVAYGSISASANLVSDGIVTYNNSQALVEYTTVEYNLKNVTGGNRACRYTAGTPFRRYTLSM